MAAKKKIPQPSIAETKATAGSVASSEVAAVGATAGGETANQSTPVEEPATGAVSPSGETADPAAKAEIEHDERKRWELFEKLTSQTVDHTAIRRYLELDPGNFSPSPGLAPAEEAAPATGQSSFEARLAAEWKVEDEVARVRKKLLVSMNRVTVVKLATELGCYDPEKILKGDVSGWLLDPVKRPVIEVLLEIEEVFQHLGPASREIVTTKTEGLRGVSPPKLPCTLLKALRYAGTVPENIKSKFLEKAFVDYLATNPDLPKGEPVRLATAARTKLPFPDEDISPGKNYKSPLKDTAEVFQRGRAPFMAVTEQETLAWLWGGFRNFWREDSDTIRSVNMGELKGEHQLWRAKQGAAAVSNIGQEFEKWCRITDACIAFFVGQEMMENQVERKQKLLEFSEVANKMDPEIENIHSQSRRKMQVFLGTLMNHLDGDDEAGSQNILGILHSLKKPEFKSVSRETVMACWTLLDAAGLVYELV